MTKHICTTGWIKLIRCYKRIRTFFPGPDGEAARFASDPLVDEVILEQMEEVFYREDFDPSLHVLKVGFGYRFCLLSRKAEIHLFKSYYPQRTLNNRFF